MKKDNFDSQLYWEKRYLTNGNSGIGSYDKDAESKSNYINDIIKKYSLKIINDYGHGDGNQLTYIKGFDEYYGYDVSKTIREKCINKFKNEDKYKFIDTPTKFTKADLSMSLDVLYHIVEEKLYVEYLKTLFNIGEYVLIYAVDDNVTGSPHYVAREFTPYIRENFPNFKLIETKNLIRDYISMYLYKKII